MNQIYDSTDEGYTIHHLTGQVRSVRVFVSYKRKYVHKLLVNRLLKPAQEKCG